ncbi:GNAT family N-acetyltransferase [Chitinimonas koreensis]|uniref:GNAT family N-acetyltransferase n=1 Tax=Chitinimonas koreensis TaxID=356302 RepID=UPI0004056529|nr:GNAT family N-acetyltransferase [Chitinimonas koreensis]QNM97247.1 GNAT family N-acetyltransferase [Chitinimonas koreensis]
MIRFLTAADAPDFQALRLAGLHEAPGAFASSHEEECGLPLDQVAARLERTAEHCVLGAFVDGRLAGIVGLAREPMRKLRHKACLWGMYVAPQWRGRGIGRALVLAALEAGRAMPGLRQVHLGVHAENAAALALYRALGFETWGTERDAMCVDGRLQDEHYMTRPLVGVDEGKAVP